MRDSNALWWGGPFTMGQFVTPKFFFSYAECNAERLRLRRPDEEGEENEDESEFNRSNSRSTARMGGAHMIWQDS